MKLFLRNCQRMHERTTDSSLPQEVQDAKEN